MRRDLLQDGLKGTIGDGAHVADGVQVAGENLAEALITGHLVQEMDRPNQNKPASWGEFHVHSSWLLDLPGLPAKGFLEPSLDCVGMALGRCVARSGATQVCRRVQGKQGRSPRAEAGV